MRMFRFVFTLALLAIAVPGIGFTQDDSGVQIGEKVEHKFRTPPVNGMGVAGLSDLLGTPVLLEFWGHR